jgi:gluconate 2-dehydrogenase gamma chain
MEKKRQGGPGVHVGRRDFLRTATLSAPAAVPVALALHGVQAATENAGAYRPRYFTEDEWQALHALVDRLIPADASGPGAVEAGVPEFIDRQMNLPYGYGHLWYMEGPYHPEVSPEFGYQLPYAPRELYRLGLASLAQQVQQRDGKRVDVLDAGQRDALLHELQSDRLALGSIPGSVFFGQLLQNTYEGYFCDPVHGGNKGMAAWSMIGFPGARADYMDWVRRYGAQYPLPPISRR